MWCFELKKPIPITLSPAVQIDLMYEHAYLAEANRATARMHGFRSVTPMLGETLENFLPRSDIRSTDYLTAFVRSGYKLSDVESREQDSSGQDKYFCNNIMGIVKDAQLVRVWGTQRDITSHHQLEIKRQQTEERLSLALKASSMGLWEWDLVTGELYWSDELKKMFGLRKYDRVTLEKYKARLHPDDREMTESTIERSRATGEMYQVEHRVVWPDGNTHWLLGRGRAYMEGNRAVRMIGTCTNIDAIKRAHEESKRQASFLEILHMTAVETSKNIGKQRELLQAILVHARTICGSADGYIYLLGSGSDELVVKLASGVFEDFLGHTITTGEGLAGLVWRTGKPQVIGDYDSWAERQISFPRGLFHAVAGIPLRVGRTMIGVLALAQTTPGKSFDKQQIATLQRLGDLASIALDGCRLFEELQESEKRFRTMADTAPVMIRVADAKGDCTYFNRPWLDFVGEPLSSQIGRGWERSVLPADFEDFMRQYNEAFATHEPYSIEYRLRRYDGTYRWILSKGVPRFSSSGRFQGFIGSCIDIDDMKRANELVVANTRLKDQRTQLLQVNKTKDEFIALASHQLRTPATAVKQYTGLLLQGFAGDLTDAQRECVRVAYESNERQLQIIDDLLRTAQIDASRYVIEKRRQDIAAVVRRAAREVRTTCELKNQRVLLVDVSPARMSIDAGEIKLVLVNLLENASKYSYPDTEITVRMVRSSTYVEIAIRDAGVGIGKADQKRIFEKFTRIDNELSDTVNGTGFGLYWVKRIIGLHGGRIRVQSEIGKGATFIVRLPL